MYEDGFTFPIPEMKSNFNIPLHVQHLGNFMLEKDKLNVPELGDFLIESEYDPIKLEDLMMLDDIRKFNMTNNVSFDDQSLPAFTEFNSAKANFVYLSSAQNSSQNISPGLKNSEEFLPNCLDTSSDTFQDLTPLMPQGTTQAVSTSSSFLSESYPIYSGNGENSSSDSTFTISSCTSETVSLNEQSSFSPPRSISNISTEEIFFESTAKCSKYSKSLVIKHETHHDIRRKNNIASQRSRMTRKEKEREMERRADVLERENENLRIKVKKMEEIAEELKRHLLQNILKR